MATLSIVIPTYTVNEELARMAVSCVKSYRGQYDELIVCEDGGLPEPELMAIADIYIRSKTNEGFTKTVNNGWRVARGDYVAIVNSDTEFLGDDLYDLCIPDAVTSPYFWNEQNRPPYMQGAFFVVPRTIFEEVGYLDERFRHYYSDTDYSLRTKDRYRGVMNVTIRHDGKATGNAAGVTHEKDSVPDGQRFGEKWYHEKQ